MASGYPVPPVMIVVAANTNVSHVITEAVTRGDIFAALGGDATFGIDSRVLAEAEAREGSGTVEREKELLRLKTATVGKAQWPDGKAPEGWEELAEPPGKNVRCVVSVGMLSEGWDAQNVTQILGLRAFGSQLLCEQVVGRGLRRMNYAPDPATGLLTPEYCDVFGVPFEVIPVQGARVSEPILQRPSTLVQALEERKGLAIEFPRVEGFVRDVRSRVQCNVAGVAALKVEPQIEPTAVVIRTQVGWVVGTKGMNSSTGEAETVTRERFYEEHRIQRTIFEMAREVTEAFARRNEERAAVEGERASSLAHRALFPQILGIVERYVDERVERAPNARIEELALKRYRDTIVSRLSAAIEPDTDAGEAALLPRIDRQRPIGSTADVQFRTVKPTKGTIKSPISHVVLDSTWEGAAAFHLEQSPHVISYAKNDRLDFEILYDWESRTPRYIPDFLVVLDVGGGQRVTLILEIKGQETEQDRAKWTAARQWVSAVNNHGGFGRWAHQVCKDPNAVGVDLTRWVEEWRESPPMSRRSAPPARSSPPTRA